MDLIDNMEKLTEVPVQKKSTKEYDEEPATCKIQKVIIADQTRDSSIIFPVEAVSKPVENSPFLKSKPKYNFSGKTVLAVDDVSFNLSLIEIFFKNTGANMLFAANGKDAVDICISNKQVDIVLMDVQMPVMNGIDATLEIKKHYPGMNVIAITAYVHSQDRRRCFDAGCCDFLPKPCSRELLLSTVSNFLHDSF
jgi:CheY-like chemotaxis protein